MTITRDPAAAAAVQAWFAAIADRGWHNATAEDAAAASDGLTPGRVLTLAGDKIDALAHLLDMVEAQSVEGAAGGATVRERLFDGIMQGFDVLQANRQGVLAVHAARDPGVGLLVAARTAPAIRRLAGAAGMATTGLSAQAGLAALALILGAAGRAWLTDGSADMAATMAELDRQLDRAERAARDGPSFDLLGLPGLQSFIRRLRGDPVRPDPDQGTPPAHDRQAG